ncbi:MAG: carbohydrate-binding domain-containing protein [Eubacteriales bacterium]|nr:carbohydrate-binding domain-containing protein [Eubacteriales bacterium]
MKKTISVILLIAAFISVFYSCAYADTPILDDQAVRYVSLDGDSISYDCGGVTASGSTLTISAPGIYSLSGTLNDGQIRIAVASDEKVEIELNGVTVTSLTGPAIYVENADKVTLDIADGTYNTVTSGNEETYASFNDSRSEAAIYSKDDLKIKGHGTITINGNINNGIASKNDIDIKSASVFVNAVNNGIKGNYSVEISDASVTINAGNDGIKTDTTKEGKGFITITGSTLTINAKDAVKADSMVMIIPDVQ